MDFRIVYIHSTDLGSYSTSAGFVVNNAVGFAEMGVKCTLILRDKSKKSSRENASKYILNNAVPPNLEIKTYGGRERTNWFFYRWAKKQIIKLKGNQLFVITRSHGVLPFLMDFQSEKIKVVFETHDYFYDLNIRSDVDPSKKKRNAKVEKSLFGQMDLMINLNKIQHDLYQKNLPKLPKLVSGTGLDIVKSNSHSRKNRVVYVGSLTKRVDFEALKSVSRALPEGWILTVIGGKSTEEEKTLRDSLDVHGPSLEFFKWMSRRDLFEILVNCKIGILPLRNDYFNEFLTVPLKLMDYFSCGLPVIASDFPSLQEQIIHKTNGILVDWGSNEQVSAAIMELADIKSWDRYNVNVMEVTENRSWQKRASVQLSKFEQMLND